MLLMVSLSVAIKTRPRVADGAAVASAPPAVGNEQRDQVSVARDDYGPRAETVYQRGRAALRPRFLGRGPAKGARPACAAVTSDHPGQDRPRPLSLSSSCTPSADTVRLRGDAPMSVKRCL